VPLPICGKLGPDELELHEKTRRECQ
jgi:hypothetical protein